MKKLNVGADASVRPLTQNGITLIALIITIIVMLILVGVTINVALNGGLFDKAKTASIQTELEQIKEQLILKKAEVIADKNGAIPSDYRISLSSLELPENLKTKYADKLIISQDGTLYYTENATATDIVYFENAGITKYQEQGINGIEYYIATLDERGTPFQVVFCVDYDNNTVKMYSIKEENTQLEQTISNLVFDDQPFTITLDDVETPITNAVSISLSNNIIAYIIGDKLYGMVDNTPGLFSSSNVYTLDPDFVLPE